MNDKGEQVQRVEISAGFEWTVRDSEGWADGPRAVVETDSVRVNVDAVWTREDGVGVEVETNDAPIPAVLAPTVAQVIADMSELSGPAER